MTSTPNLLPDYRRDIDGLRAYAVALVVGFHAFPDAAPGGFVGVDVFFVISGFLISTIIFKSLGAGGFSFADFYIRRIKRIFPALVLVLFLVLALGWIVLLKDEYRQLGQHVIAGAAFLSNFLLMREAGYFDNAAELKPLLHLWSLGIEEQFYLAWPLAVVVAYRWRRRVGIATALVLIASFALNAGRAGGSHAVQTFFHPLTRYWELLIGSYLAWTRQRESLDDNWVAHCFSLAVGSSWLRDAYSIGGIAMILIAVALLDQSRVFPGYWALLPTLGTAMVIAAGPNAIVNKRLLSGRWIVGLGLVSYPLYLWHWPLLSIARIVTGDTPTIAMRIVVIAISVILAIVTYRYVEKPFRISNRSYAGSDPTYLERNAVTFLVTAMIIIGIAGWLASRGYLGHRLVTLDVISDARDDWGYPKAHANDRHPEFGFPQRVLPGRKKDTILFIGDSNVEQFFPVIRGLHELGGMQPTVVFVTAGGCSPIPEVEQTNGMCKGIMRRAFDYANDQHVRKVVLGATWSYFGTTKYGFMGESPISEGRVEAVFDALIVRVRELILAGKEVYLILPVPQGPQMDPERMINFEARISGLPNRIEPLRLADFRARQHLAYEQLGRVAMRSGAILLDPAIDICTNGTCANLSEDGRPIAKDAGHLRPYFVKERMRIFDRLLAQ